MRSACWFVLALFVGAVAASRAAWPQENRGYLGVDLQDVTKEEADKLGWEAPRGIKVVNPREGGPAAAAGVLPDDIITSLDGQDVENMARFVASIGDRDPGAQVRLRLLRGGRERTIAVVLGRRPTDIAETKEPAKRDLPFLQLDTGGHMAIIQRLAFTPDGRHLISAGDDKVIRVWDWRTGATVRSIRGQAGTGDEGKVYAVVLSPDGRLLATGGWTHAECIGRCGEIRLYEFVTGQLVALFKGHTDVVNGLAFTADGKRLMSGSADNTAIIWDVERRALAHHLRGHTDQVQAVGFSPDGARAVTGSHDKTLKLWSVAEGKEIATLSGHTNKVWALDVAATDGRIASGSDSEIRLWDGRTGSLLRTLAHPGDVGSLRFGADGQLLLSTCGFRGCDDVQRLWEVASGKVRASYRGHDGVVVAAALSPNGQLVATGGGSDHQIDMWSASTGQLQQGLAGKGASVWAAAISADGRRIAWGNTWAAGHSGAPQPLQWQLRLPQTGSTLGLPERVGSEAAATFLRAHTMHGATTLAHRKGGDYGYADAILDVSRDGKVQASITRGSRNGYTHSAYTLVPDNQSLISGGGGGTLIAYDLQGSERGRFVGHEGKLWALAPSADGRLLVSGSNDQTIRLWNIKTREVIVTLFHGTDGEWVMWTPQGYYTGSPGADKIVGWQINKGQETAADYVGADQLREHLNRPDIVDKAIILASAEQAVREAAGTSFKLADLLTKPVPRFRVASPAAGSTQRGGRAQVKIAIAAVPDPVKVIRIQVNGRNVEGITPDVGAGGLTGDHTFDVPLAKGRNEVRVTLANATGEKGEALVLEHEGDGDLDQRGTLYILAIGVDRYPGMGNTCGNGSQSCDLRFAGADARAWADATERRLAAGHRKVVKQVLVNSAGDKDAPTAANITDAIDVLRDAAQDTDTVLLFIAGHGMNDGGDYRFLATNAERTNSGALRGSTVVPWQLLQGSMEATKGRRVLFLDTCHSGNAYSPKLGNSAYHANIITYASARFDQEALEDAKLGHGLFTYAVAEALGGERAFADKREITTKGLAEYVLKRVDQLAKDMKGSQEPQYFRGRDAEDYVLARW